MTGKQIAIAVVGGLAGLLVVPVGYAAFIMFVFSFDAPGSSMQDSLAMMRYAVLLLPVLMLAVAITAAIAAFGRHNLPFLIALGLLVLDVAVLGFGLFTS